MRRPEVAVVCLCLLWCRQYLQAQGLMSCNILLSRPDYTSKVFFCEGRRCMLPFRSKYPSPPSFLCGLTQPLHHHTPSHQASKNVCPRRTGNVIWPMGATDSHDRTESSKRPPKHQTSICHLMLPEIWEPLLRRVQ